MSFEEKQEQRRRRQREFWAAEAENALDDVRQPVEKTFDALRKVKTALDSANNPGHETSTEDILAVATAAAEAKALLSDIVRDLGGAAVLLNVPTAEVAAACHASVSTVTRWSSRQGSAAVDHPTAANTSDAVDISDPPQALDKDQEHEA